MLFFGKHIGHHGFTMLHLLLLTKGRFTRWTMKSNHGRWPFCMVQLDGPTSMVWFLKKLIYKAFGPFTRYKSNVDQEEWPCTKSKCVDISSIWPKKGSFEKHSSLTILLSSSSLPQKTFNWKFIITSFLYHRPLLIFIRAPLLPIHCKNLLDHVSE